MSVAAEVSAAYVQEQLTGLAALVQSYATGPTLVAAVSRPGGPDLATVDRRLAALQAAHPDLFGAWLLDPQGRALAVQPADPGFVGSDLSYRDYVRGLGDSYLPYVSEAFVASNQGNPVGVAVSINVRGRPRQDHRHPRRRLPVRHAPRVQPAPGRRPGRGPHGHGRARARRRGHRQRRRAARRQPGRPGARGARRPGGRRARQGHDRRGHLRLPQGRRPRVGRRGRGAGPDRARHPATAPGPGPRGGAAAGAAAAHRARLGGARPTGAGGARRPSSPSARST